MIAFFLVLERVMRRNAISFQISDEIKKMALICIISSVVGAVIFESLYHNSGKVISFEGFTFYGGLLVSLFTLWILARLKKMDFFNLTNILTVPLTIAHAFGRIGCFLGGCCYGIPTTCSLGVVFPDGSIPFTEFGHHPIHPTQLYESFFLFLLSFLLYKINLNWRFTVYLLSYPIIRLLIEMFRGDDRGSFVFDGLSPSQEISLVLFLIGVLMLFLKLNPRNIKSESKSHLS